MECFSDLYMRFGLMCSYNTENYNCFFYLWSVKPLWKVKLLGQWLNFRSVESSWASVVNRSKWKTICLHTFQRADLEGVRRFLWKPRLNEKKENNITPWLGLYLKPPTLKLCRPLLFRDVFCNLLFKVFRQKPRLLPVSLRQCWTEPCACIFPWDGNCALWWRWNIHRWHNQWN